MAQFYSQYGEPSLLILLDESWPES